MDRYDAVICGAGPSGSTAAKYLAEKGLSVVILEKNSFPRDKPCGGALRPSVVEEFDFVREGLSKIPHSICKRAKMYGPNLKNHVDYNPNKVVMYNIQRKHFDNMLADLAVDAGAELRENNEVKGVQVGGSVYSLKLKNGGEVAGKVIIGAGGVHDPVAKYLRKKEGLPPSWPKSDIGLVVMEEFQVSDDFIIDRFGEERTAYFHLRPDNIYGYAWIFSKKNILNIGYGAFWEDMKKVNIKGRFSDYIKLLKDQQLAPKDLKPDSPKGAPIPLRGAITTTYSDSMLVCGDAAGFVSPVGGDGIYFSLASGKIAADVVEHAVSNDSYGKETMAQYQREWYGQWGKDLKALCYFADKIFKRTEQVLKYASRDSILCEKAVGLYNGDIKAARMKFKIQRRMVRDFFLYDILRLK